MAYTNLGTFLTRVTIKAIEKLEDASADECMRIAANVNSWAAAGTITDDQVAQLAEALPGDFIEQPAQQPAEYDFSNCMTAAEVKRSLSYRPTLDEYRQACDWLGLDWDESMTRAALAALIDEAAGAGEASDEASNDEETEAEDE